MRIGVCDDEPAELAALARMVESICARRGVEGVVERFLSGEDLLVSLRRSGPLDILFLDVYMGSRDGVTVARRIRETDTKCRIIFATSSREHAIDGYGVHALQYLLKPLAVESVEAALEQALVDLSRREDRWIDIQKRQGCYRVLLSDIIYAESNARVVTIHTGHLGDIDYYGRLDDLSQRLDDRFFRCHKSFLVNFDFVHAIVGDSILLEGGRAIRISRGVAAAKGAFASYTARQI